MSIWQVIEIALFIASGGYAINQFFVRGRVIGGAALLVFCVFWISNFVGLFYWIFPSRETAPLTTKVESTDGSHTTERFVNGMTACALGLKIEIKGNLEGSLRTFYEGLRTSGSISSETKTEFLKLFPESERTAAYELYTGCLMKTLNIGNNVGADAMQSDQEFLVYRAAATCIKSSCVFEKCLAIYTTVFPFGTGTTFLKTDADRAGNSARCKPPEPAPASSVKCVTFNGKQVCG